MARAATTAKTKPKPKTKAKPRAKAKAKPKWKSRAVTRLIEAGSMTECSHCEERVKFKARERHMQVICNVYINGCWDRVEHFHAPCYDEAGQPFGAPQE